MSYRYPRLFLFTLLVKNKCNHSQHINKVTAKGAASLNYGIIETNCVPGTHPGSVRAHNSQFYDIVVAGILILLVKHKILVLFIIIFSFA